MIEYTIRFFTVSPLFSIIPLQAQMIQQGFRVQPGGTNRLDIAYTAERTPFIAELTDSTSDTTKDEVAEFIEAVQAVDDPGRETVLNLLTQTKAIIAVGVPTDFAGGDVLDRILDIVAEMGDGLFHVEGEGFYQNGELIVGV